MKPVEVRDLVFRVGDSLILDHVDFDLEDGEFVGLIGPNGGGKTTFIQALVGTLRGWSGSVKVFGRSPMSLGADRHLIAYVPQLSMHAPDFPATARDVALTGRVALRGLGRRLSADDRAAADRALAAVDMDDYADAQIGDLSGGQRQRVFIARAIAGEPRLLVLDEPMTGVDRAAEESFYDLLAGLKEERGLSIIMASHDLTMVSRHASTVACLNRSMHCHAAPDEVDHEEISRMFGRHVEFIIHGDVPHRVVRRHENSADGHADVTKEH